MSVEKLLGVRVEYTDTNFVALTTIVLTSRVYARVAGTIVEGQLPKTGPALIVANHTSSTDILKMCHAGVSTAQRIIRGVARKSLLDPKYKESEEVLERTGKKDRFDPMQLFLVAPAIAFILNGVGAISVKRGRADIECIKNCDYALSKDQMVGIFPQETRVREGDLRNIMPGIGFLARRHAEIPVVPVGISGHIVRIGQSFTYLSLEQSLNRTLDIRETTAEIVDRIAELLPQDVKTKWALTDRPLFLSKV